jgi:hypothetical protein
VYQVVVPVWNCLKAALHITSPHNRLKAALRLPMS